MRISSNMMRYNFLRSLNDSMETQNTLQEQLSDGKSLHRPSDDPVRAVRDLTYKTSQVLNEQYTQNLQDAKSWMENTDGVMSDLSSVMIKVKELVVSADDTKPTDALNTIGAQIDGLINQVVSLGNTKIGDRYLFGGQNDSTQPFVRTTIKDPNSDLTKEVVIYNGDNSRISMPIQAGAVNPTQDSVNLTGTDVFGDEKTIYGRKTLSVLNQLLEIKNELCKTSTVDQTNTAGGTGTVGGKYTGAGYANFDVRVDSVDQSGGVLGASYSSDGGNTWITVGANGTNTSIDNEGNPAVITLPNGVKFNISDSAKITQTNSLGGTASVAKGGTATDYTVTAQTVNADGQFTQYSLDGGTTWNNIDADHLSDTTKSVIILPNGSSLNIAADVINNHDGDTYTVKVTGNMEITQSNATGGVAKVSDSSGYMVQVDAVDPTTKQVTAATYSIDGGTTWNAFAVTDYSDPTKTALTLPDGSILNIGTDLDNAVGNQYTIKPETHSGNVYSFRVPQDAFDVAQSNASGGAAAITGTATNTESIPNSVRIDSIDSSGQVMAASYSSDGGSTWTSLSNYNVTQTNSSGSVATVTGNLTAGPYTVAITGVDENGKITEVNGNPAINITYDVTTDTDTGKTSSTANIQLATGVVLHIPTNTANKTTDTYTVTAKAKALITTTGADTVINLPSGSTPSGLTMTIAASTNNKINDAYSFDLPQGKGPDTTWLSSVATQYVSDDHNLQLKAQTTLGARMSMYEMAYNMLLNQNTVIQTDIANTEDIDMAKAITDFNTAQNIYRSALAVGGKIMPTSLVDFLS